MIDQQQLQAIRDRTDIVGLIGAHTTLKKAGKNFKGLCPFHAETSPSFVVNRERGIYRCFGCGASGNVFTFVMETRKVDFAGAVKILQAEKGSEG